MPSRVDVRDIRKVDKRDGDMEEQRELMFWKTLARLYILRDDIDGIVVLTDNPRGKRRKVIRNANQE